MKLKIAKYPDKILYSPCDIVQKIDDALVLETNDMLETMYIGGGIGLAANQVFINKKIIVIDLQQENNDTPVVLINPEILNTADSIMSSEGCLSFPELTVNIARAKHVFVKALSLDEKEIYFEASNLFAVVIQHEIDHINGITFLDKLGKYQKDLFIKQYNKRNASIDTKQQP